MTTKTQGKTVMVQGTLMMTDTFILPAVPAKGKAKARPERTMGILGILVEETGEYVEVTDFSKAWQSLPLDGKVRIVTERVEREKDGREVVYHNLKRAMVVPPAQAPVEELVEA